MSPDNHKARKTSKSSSSKTRSGKRKVEWKGYVNYPLTDSTKERIASWQAQNVDLDQLIEDAAMNGLDLKIRYDHFNQCFAAQFYCTDATSDDAGWCLSLRASGWSLALQRLLYVHYVCLEGVWSEAMVDGWSDDNW